MVSCQAKTNCWLYYKVMRANEIKERLREEIARSGMTKAEIAKKVGVSPEMITQYCTTGKLPRLDTFAALCEALDVSANYILGLKDI